MFAGSCSIEGATFTDIKDNNSYTTLAGMPENFYVAPYDNLPPELGEFDFVVADPPYTKGFAREWTDLEADIPRPKYILREAARVVKPGGLIFILHVIIIPAYKIFGVKRVALHPILAGPNNAIRVLNVLEKQ